MSRRWYLLLLGAGIAAAFVLASSFGLPATDTWQLVGISFSVAAGVGLVGEGLFAGLRRRRLAIQGLVVVFVAVGAVLAGAVVAARAMFVSTHDLEALMVVLVAAGTVAALAGLRLASRLDDASRRLGDVTRRIALGEGAAAGDLPPVPEELARLGRELEEMRVRLEDSRVRGQRVEQSRREVIAWVSHDLRTPIARLRAMVEAINDGVVVDDVVDDYHHVMQREVERLGELVDDLFELSRIQADAVRLTLEPVVLAELVSDTIASARASADHKGVQLYGDAIDNQAMAELSIPEMARVLHNLLDNAIRHSPPGGEVRVSVDSIDDDVVVAVSDQCGGIAEHDLERVFDLAYRGDPARTQHDVGVAHNAQARSAIVSPVSGGGGLGLAIAKGFVEAHHGMIAVRNEGVGCTFTVSMPRVRTADAD